jgi:serpin B
MMGMTFARALPLTVLLATTTAAHADPAAFAVGVYGKIAERNAGKNVIFSPASISIALGMTREGARGETLAEMTTLLGGDGRVILPKSSAFELRTANRLWIQSGYPIERDFLTAVADRWAAPGETVDFRSDAERITKRINAWVLDQTNRKIVDLVPRGVITDLTRLVLVNAIYFKGKWAVEFDKKKTKDEAFFVAADRQVKTALMAQHGSLPYARIDGAQLVALPYKGDALEMVVIVPDAKDGLAAVERRLGATGALAGWLAGLRKTELDLFLPRFKATLAVGLAPVLRDLGMRLAFDAGRADFSGIARPASTGEPPLYISAVVHQAFIEVNEEGTEAAAATAVIVSTSDAVQAPPPVVRADRPFLFLIRDRKTGTVLFMGRVSDPTSR